MCLPGLAPATCDSSGAACSVQEAVPFLCSLSNGTQTQVSQIYVPCSPPALSGPLPPPSLCASVMQGGSRSSLRLSPAGSGQSPPYRRRGGSGRPGREPVRGFGRTGRPGATLSSHHHPQGVRGLDKLAGRRREGLCPHTPISSPHTTGLSSLARLGRPKDRDAGSWVGACRFRAFSGKASSQRGGLGACPHARGAAHPTARGPAPMLWELTPGKGPTPCGSHAVDSLRTDCTSFSFHPQQMRVQ